MFYIDAGHISIHMSPGRMDMIVGKQCHTKVIPVQSARRKPAGIAMLPAPLRHRYDPI